MKQIKKTKHFSWTAGELAKGCKLCVQGKKTVLFITGVCPRKCEYCPISELKYQKDVIYANEMPVKSVDAVIEEIKMCSSKGVGITGGDPLSRLDRTVEYISELKKEFGKTFHIHLYTSLILVTEKTLDRLFKAGLDEIRFHPDLDSSKLWSRINISTQFDWDVGVEIPIIPGKENKTKKLIDFVNDKVTFLNLNELELSDTPGNKLVLLGYKSKDGVSYGVSGSEQLGKKLLDYCANKGINVHYCTAKLKDARQLKERIKRRAKKSAKDFDIITDEGTLIRSVIYSNELFPSVDYTNKLKTISNKKRKQILDTLKQLRKHLCDEFEIPFELIIIDETSLRIITTGAVLEELSEEINSRGFKCAVLEEYPTWDGLIVDLDFV